MTTIPPTSEEMALWASLYEHARQLRGDELRVLVQQAARLVMGREHYGQLDLSRDRRDLIRELLAEFQDASNYASMRLLQLLSEDET